jgi:hypothetical protein
MMYHQAVLRGAMGGSMRHAHFMPAILSLCMICFPVVPASAFAQSALPKPDQDTVLKSADIKARLFPEAVFFPRAIGASADAQHRRGAFYR